MPRLRPSAFQAAAWRHACVENPAADRHDQPALLGERDEARGGHDATLRVTPAHERLGADDAPARQIEDRLVVRGTAARRRAPRRDRTAARGVLRHRRAALRRTARSDPCRRPSPRTARDRRRAADRPASRSCPLATPMLAVTENSLPASPSSTGSRSVSVSRSASASACASAASPRRAPRTRLLRAARPCPARARRAAAVRPTTVSRRSPAAWPRLSLTCLKPSMSMNSAPATVPGLRAARASICSARSSTSARLGRPVRGSCSARCESSRVFSRTSDSARTRPVASTSNSRPEQPAQQDAADEQRQRVRVAEDAPGDAGGEALHGPAVARAGFRCSALQAGSCRWRTPTCDWGVRSGNARRGLDDHPARGRARRRGRASSPSHPTNARRRAAGVEGVEPPR